LADPALRVRMGALGRQRIEERYSLASQAPRLVDAVAEPFADGANYAAWTLVHFIVAAISRPE
jgi:hypothetical protein